MASGAITGFFNTVFKIPPILSGILTMLATYIPLTFVLCWESQCASGQDGNYLLPLFKVDPIQTDLLIVF